MILLIVYGVIYGEGGSIIWFIGILVVFIVVFYVIGVLFKCMFFL